MRKAPVLLALLLCTLTACGGDSAANAAGTMQSAYQDAPAITAEAEITAEYPSRAYAFSVRWEGNETDGTLTVTAPEEIAGTGGVWTEGSLSLTDEGTVLELGTPEGMKQTPVGAIPRLLELCRCGTVTGSQWEKNGDGGKDLRLRLAAADGTEEVTLLLSGGGPRIRQAELWQEGRRVMSLQFNEYKIKDGSAS